jgi:sec-independent protein translocase protein TatB
MGNLGGGEVLVILLVALLILGPAKLPDAARQLGRAMGEIRKVTSGFQRELQDALKDSDDAAARRRGEAIAATRPVATAPHLLDDPPADGAPQPPTNGATAAPVDAVTREQAAAQIPPAPAGDATPLAPGSDR